MRSEINAKFAKLANSKHFSWRFTYVYDYPCYKVDKNADLMKQHHLNSLEYIIYSSIRSMTRDKIIYQPTTKISAIMVCKSIIMTR